MLRSPGAPGGASPRTGADTLPGLLSLASPHGQPCGHRGAAPGAGVFYAAAMDDIGLEEDDQRRARASGGALHMPCLQERAAPLHAPVLSSGVRSDARQRLV